VAHEDYLHQKQTYRQYSSMYGVNDPIAIIYSNEMCKFSNLSFYFDLIICKLKNPQVDFEHFGELRNIRDLLFKIESHCNQEIEAYSNARDNSPSDFQEYDSDNYQTMLEFANKQIEMYTVVLDFIYLELSMINQDRKIFWFLHKNKKELSI